MGQKIHPLGFRLGITQKHRSQWFPKAKHYPQLVFEDNTLRKTLFDRFPEAGITDIHIERKLDQIKIEIKAARPGIILGRESQGKALEVLRAELEQKLKKQRAKTNFSGYLDEGLDLQIAITVKKLANPFSEAAFITDTLIEQLETRVAFRRALKQALKKAKRAGVKGIKIQVSGRLNGAEIARSEWVREGRVPLQTLRAEIDYCYRTAKTIYGLLGIKVWVFKGEVLDSK
jgi:small subunit ribosomal protein S3|uniref:Small ribosomal subunit protein uS3c n=1 Tax=Parietochloris pseudoalveolaris TaxID=3102 RepID=A0A097KLJ4_9CHLO|nr:ribosomal protein S3 [Parietochloris pseudoalveolaris]AIT94052.1 ribosomal protein S3 [Parietochloris pseudoalveolaris]